MAFEMYNLAIGMNFWSTEMSLIQEISIVFSSSLAISLIFHHIFKTNSNRATIIVLIVESRWTESPRRNFIIENNSTCYLREEYEIILDCHPCTGNIDHPMT